MKKLYLKSHRLEVSNSLRDFSINNMFQAVRGLLCLDRHTAHLVLAVENSRAQPGADSYSCSISIPKKGIFLKRQHHSLYAAIEQTADKLREILRERARKEKRPQRRHLLRRIKRTREPLLPSEPTRQ